MCLSCALSLSTAGCRRCNTADGGLAADFIASQLCITDPRKFKRCMLYMYTAQFSCLGSSVVERSV